MVLSHHTSTHRRLCACCYLTEPRPQQPASPTTTCVAPAPPCRGCPVLRLPAPCPGPRTACGLPQQPAGKRARLRPLGARHASCVCRSPWPTNRRVSSHFTPRELRPHHSAARRVRLEANDIHMAAAWATRTCSCQGCRGQMCGWPSSWALGEPAWSGISGHCLLGNCRSVWARAASRRA